MTYPNQKIIHINKQKYEANFLQIGIDEWQEALKLFDKKASVFCLYLYLAGNKDGYNLELSKEAFEKATGFKKSSYCDGINKLIELGYLVHKQGNIYDFFTRPVRSDGQGQNTFHQSEPTLKDFEAPPQQTNITAPTDLNSAKTNNNSAPTVQAVRPANREIDNINKINNKIDKTDRSVLSLDKEKKKGMFDEYFDPPFSKDYEIKNYLKTLPDGRKKEYGNVEKRFLNMGKSIEWIRTAITHKAVSTWAEWGFGLFSKPDFIEQINFAVEKEKQKAEELKEIQKRALKAYDELNAKGVEKIYVRGSEPKKTVFKEIDLSTLTPAICRNALVIGSNSPLLQSIVILF